MSAIILADTVSPAGARLTTILLRYPRMIHPELLTHRCFSRSSESSRAVNAVKRSKVAVYTPVEFGRDGKGMTQGAALTEWRHALATLGWAVAIAGSRLGARLLRAAGAHKQYANRPLDWCAHIEVVVTGDSVAWASFLALRDHPDAQPEMQELALDCRLALHFSEPRPGDLHIPWDVGPGYTPHERAMASAGYCAGVSYLNHGKAAPETAIAVAERMLRSSPPHWSPFEHQAVAGLGGVLYDNFIGWFGQRYGIKWGVGGDAFHGHGRV